MLKSTTPFPVIAVKALYYYNNCAGLINCRPQEEQVINIFILIVTGVVIVFLLFLLLKLDKKAQSNSSYKTPDIPNKTAKVTQCPLCNSDLSGPKRVKSVLYPGKPDSMMEIFGCPNCYPVNSNIPRYCPVCKNEVPKDGHVIARVFIKPQKNHVHVLGCTGCYKRRWP